MITGFLLSILVAFVTFLIQLLPVGGLPSGVTDAITYIAGVMNTFNFILPISTLFTILTFGLSFQFVIWLWEFSMWIMRMVRGN